ncbi:odorant receptor 74a-like [Musca domestica]|uniref:Odorant receptor n=1 Tax=Musca domestica TaxID=7370 RepID=A0ABM3V724_MUSDO|nr:odorant receptor 74a-like [Musca domestica]
MLYRPRLPDGRKVPLSWPIALFRLTNNICWPLEENASWLAVVFDRFCWYLAFILFVITNDAEFRYLRVNINNLDEMLTGVPTYLVLIEIHLRAFTLGWRKQDFRRLLEKFYRQIYIESSLHPTIFKNIRSQLMPIFVLSSLYLSALISYVILPIYFLSIGSRELMYKMIPAFDYSPLWIYLLCCLSNLWIGVIVATMMLGEATVLSTLVFHLNGRYLMMREKLMAKVDVVLEKKKRDNGNQHIAAEYNKILVETLQENVALNTFAQEIQREYSFRLFVIVAFMAASLCGLGFKVYTSPMTSIGYIFWAIGKIQEILAIGTMGSTIVTITNQISSMYYESNWELVVFQSEDSKSNARLMKLVQLAIATNSKPFCLTGLNFFTISTTTALAILQGAGSYFTCLTSFR